MATSQVVTLDPATGARAVLTSGPGRKYQPKWVGDGVAYTRGGVDEQRGVRQRVNYVAHGISFTDGRGTAGRVLQRELVSGRQAHGVPPVARRHVAAGHAGVQSRSRVRRCPRRRLSVVLARRPLPDVEHRVCRHLSEHDPRDEPGRYEPARRVRASQPERARAGVVALRRPHRLRAGEFLRRWTCGRVRTCGHRRPPTDRGCGC